MHEGQIEARSRQTYFQGRSEGAVTNVMTNALDDPTPVRQYFVTGLYGVFPCAGLKIANLKRVNDDQINGPALEQKRVTVGGIALNLQFRDVRYALPFFIQLLVYCTPVFYPATLVPARYRPLFDLNPMAAVVDSFRACLFGTAIPFQRLLLATVTATAVGVVGFMWFRRMERTFADRI